MTKFISISIACFCLLCVGCSTPRSVHPVISVSIAPLGYLAQQITDSDFTYNILVPPGASPETYEPSVSQMRQLAQSQIYIHTGLIDFENQLQHAIEENMPHVTQIRVADGVELIEGSCTHTASHTPSDNEEVNPVSMLHEEHAHHHGVDPHIWNSPRTLKKIATTIYHALAERYPDSVRYKTNYLRLMSRLDSLDGKLQQLFETPTRTFIIYHPALTYLARDYGLHQIAIENEGKEPSAEYVRNLIDSARQFKLTKLFYQRQFSRSTVDALAKELNLQAVSIDPLAPNVIDNTLVMSREIVTP